ncbi:uncharacterized protein HMPREF1541_04355 [Cyphellophora europaea CBS 101466]|uniref:Small secreted protein n=1 Tax=Cyphellophora europaea (strain CBS 101466) TaxID=1220924 RepID=W2RUU8_CYPE1|nr:uncharacterized protein HMPREF1541_04355 [Cyphellophora europaea CBS 101466]ETN40080.1 hypothetical protein HMPREF1541_04355 [Cyphellophora europaea CBS 101466]
MRLSTTYALGSLLAGSVSAQISTNVTTPSLNLTTITAHDGRSAYECWQIPGFVASTTAGTTGALNLFLGATTNASFTVLPPRFEGGVHTAPAPQLVYFTSGLIHLTLPEGGNRTEKRNDGDDSTASVWIHGGKYGLILALDTPDVSDEGHITTYPSAADTVAIQIPFSQEGYAHLLITKQVLYPGGCKESQLIGL